MNYRRHASVILLVVLALCALPRCAHARKWSDASGRFSLEADLIAWNDESVVLQKRDRQLASIKIDQLSKADQEFLKSEEAQARSQGAPGQGQTWMLTNGLALNGRVVGYARRDVVVQRKRGKVYVNDRLFDNLPGVYKRMVPKVVAHFEQLPIENEKQLMEWAIKQKGQPKKYTIEGVMLELENGDEYGVPFFFLSEEDLQVLKPGWDRWKAAEDEKAKREHEEFLVQAQAAAYQRDRQANQQITQMQLALLATAAGVTKIWEVQLLPKRGVAGGPISVMVPARDSRQAQNAAMNQNPGYVAGATRKLSSSSL